MTNKLHEGLDTLRAIAPALNAVADEANRMVKDVEKILVEVTGSGISAGAEFERKRCEDDDFEEYEIRRVLSFGRICQRHCIFVRSTHYAKESSDQFTEEKGSIDKRWSQCDRETRLRAFDVLPDLIQAIVREAQRLKEVGEKTAAKVKELMGEDVDFGDDLDFGDDDYEHE
jgi:hypothetical protein